MSKPDGVKTWGDLNKLAVARLRELAAEDTSLENASGQEKPALLDALAEAYGIEQPKQVRARGIKLLKGQIKGIRKQRDELLTPPPAGRDRKQLGRVRKQMKQLKRRMRKLSKAS